MSGGHSTWRLERSLASKLGVHLAIIDEVMSRLDSLGWPEKEAFGIQLALEESLTNAVRHGNKEDARKRVSFVCEVSSSRFWAQVRDEGEGFCPGDVPDPTQEENLTSVGGRGLLLIRSYMTDVCYNASGNCVTLLKIRGQSCEDACTSQRTGGD